MKLTIRFVQFLVGALFIVSGLVKANDPLGLAYKMEEFFQLWNEGLAKSHFFARGGMIDLFSFLSERKLFLSVAMITLEIVAGVALLVGFKKRFVLYLLFALIIFFTFLTGYAYLSGKFTNCGCFGDCLPITPLTSFAKDIFLLFFVVVLIIGRKNLFTVSSNGFRDGITYSTLGISLVLQWYVLHYMPVVDCLPLKKGNNISEQIKSPKNAIPSVYETRLVYENVNSHQLKVMSQDEFNGSRIWEDKNWKWKETETKLVKQGTDMPKLHNFSLTTINGQDLTESILNNSNYLLLYWVDLKENPHGVDHEIVNTATGLGIQTFFVTTNTQALSEQPFTALVCDGTVFRIAARTNPTIYLLKKGTVLNKWSINKKKGILAAIHEFNNQKNNKLLQNEN